MEHGYSSAAQAEDAKSEVKLEAHRRPSRKMGLRRESKIASRSVTEGGTRRKPTFATAPRAEGQVAGESRGQVKQA